MHIFINEEEWSGHHHSLSLSCGSRNPTGIAIAQPLPYSRTDQEHRSTILVLSTFWVSTMPTMPTMSTMTPPRLREGGGGGGGFRPSAARFFPSLDAREQGTD